jgi:rhodanese-related sulfurtransferase
MKDIAKMMNTGEITVVDVRSPGEFRGAHVAGSVNIPLQEIPLRIDELREMKHVILCCASGNRSGQATSFLKQQGISCENGGSWLDVNAYC